MWIVTEYASWGLDVMCELSVADVIYFITIRINFLSRNPALYPQRSWSVFPLRIFLFDLVVCHYNKTIREAKFILADSVPVSWFLLGFI